MREEVADMRRRTGGRLQARFLALAVTAVALGPWLLTGASGAAPTGYAATVLADNPASYWRFGESSGTTAVDERGQNPGTYAGGVTLGQPGALSGDPNKSISFDGVNDAMTAPDSPSLDLSSAVSIEAWVKRSKSGVYQEIVGKPGNGQSKQENYSLWFTYLDRLRAYFGNGNTYASATSPAAIDTKWHYVVATYNNASAKMYLDGVLVDSENSTVQMAPNQQQLTVGRTSTNGSWYGGQLDELAIYPSVLSAAQVSAHYNAASVDIVAPVISLTAPSAGATTSNSTPTFAGTAGTSAGDLAAVTVKVYPGSSATGTPTETLNVTRNADGSYRVDASPALADGVWTAQAEQSDASGNIGRSGAVTFTVDTTAPVTTITSGPASLTKTTTATISFTVGESGANASCSLDGGAFASCTSPKTYSGLADGNHTFRVHATDAAGNVGADDTRMWTVDTVPPNVAITTAPPDPSSSTDAAFAFSVDEIGAAAACSLDGGAFTACASPATYSGLADGSHTVRIHATDAAGNTGPDATRTWTVDTVKPVTTITNGPPSVTNQTNATFTFTVDDGTATSACSLDGSAFAPCTSPKTYNGLSDGPHTVRIHATDPAGNVGDDASRSWQVATGAPAVTLATPADGASLASTTVTFSGTGGTGPRDDGTVTVSIWSGSSASGTPLKTLSATVAGNGSYSTQTTLSEGTYTARTEQHDSAGNTGFSSTNTFTVDTTAPVVYLASPPDGVTTDATTPTYNGHGGLLAGDSNIVSIDVYAGSTTNGTPLQTLTASVRSSDGFYRVVPATALTDGVYTAVARQSDAAGNVGTSRTHTFTIDTSQVYPPIVTLTSPFNGAVLNSTLPAFGGSGGTETGDATNVVIDVYTGTVVGGVPAQSFPAPVQDDGTYSATPPAPLAEGTYTARASQSDSGGNVGYSAARTFTIDITPPTASVDSAPANPTNSTSATFTFSANESATFECALDAGAYTPCTSPVTYTSLLDGTHTFHVRATDRAGNLGAAATRSWTVDTQAPVTSISSHPSDPSPSASATFGFASDDPAATFTCSLDGGAYTSCSSPTTLTGLADGTHTFRVRATDLAGNVGTAASFTWVVDTTAPPSPSFASKPANPTNVTTAAFVLADSEAGVSFECQLDGASFTACTTMPSYPGLADGSHTLAARAVDTAGNRSATASYTWTVDTQAPSATITGGPGNPTNATTASFSFTASEPATTACSLDGGAFTGCSSPQSYQNITGGSHTFRVRATDLAGNTGAAASFSWTVDTVAPTLTLTASRSRRRCRRACTPLRRGSRPGCPMSARPR